MIRSRTFYRRLPPVALSKTRVLLVARPQLLLQSKTSNSEKVIVWNMAFSNVTHTPDATTQVNVTVNKSDSTTGSTGGAKDGEVKTAACGDIDDTDDAMEQEDMFVDAHESFEFQQREWGGPRRGGRLLEPTRFGDWERKGRCSDF